MTIGILTYHRSHNFGALFQAIASRSYLESLGYKVYYINYWPEYHKAMYSPFSLWALRRRGIKGGVYYARTSIKNLFGNLKRRNIYNKFIKRYIQPFYAFPSQEYDVIFYGSDQIWRKQPYINDYNPVYFAHNNYKSLKHVSLSASVGILPENNSDINRFKGLLDRFDAISVREHSVVDLLHSFGYKATLCCDPALLLNSRQWDSIFPQAKKEHEKYLLHVNYIEDSFDLNEVKSLATSLGLKMVCINGSVIVNHHKGDLNNVGPEALFNYIRNADFVCTSSFHALVFSLLYHKQVYASFKQNSKRAESLLESLEIRERLLPIKSAIPHDKVLIDYKSVDRKLSDIRRETMNFINTVLE